MKNDQLQLQLNLLSDTLSEQLGIYWQLLDLAQSERKAVAASKLDDLCDVIAEKKYLVQKLSEIEKRRIELMTGIAVGYNLDSDQHTLRHLTDCVDQHMAKELNQLHTDLSTVIKKLQEENNTNKILMEHCISLVDNSINMLNFMNYQENIYVKSGHITKTQGNGVLFTSKI